MAVGGTAVNTGTGTTLTFVTSGWSNELLSASWSGITRPSIDTACSATVKGGTDEFGSRPALPGDLVDPGELTAEVHLNPDDTPPIGTAAEVIRVTFPLYGTDQTATKWECTGFCTSFEWGSPLEDKMTATLTIKFTGGADITQSLAAV